MKILFLDVDGVINSEKTFQRFRGVIGIDPFMAFLVGKIVLDTDCKVVLSSSWRGYSEGEAEIKRQCTDFIDRTPYCSDGVRGDEIASWLQVHPEVIKYAILDDDSDMLEEQKPNFFQTSWKEGITEEIAKKVTEHLNKK